MTNQLTTSSQGHQNHHKISNPQESRTPMLLLPLLLLLLLIALSLTPPPTTKPVLSKQSASAQLTPDQTPPDSSLPIPAKAPPPDAPKFARAKVKKLKDKSPIPKNQKKPAWVIGATLCLLAISKEGCRTVANLFNQKYANRGVTIGKTYVSELRKNSKFLLIQINRRLRKPAKRKRANWEWAIDYTEINIHGERINLIGIIDGGTRRLLELRVADKSSDTLQTVLERLMALHGTPKFIKTDNDGSFVSEKFKAFLESRDITHRRSEPMSPWQNGTIERFFRTLKDALATIKIESRERLMQAIGEFQFFYNHIRPHQSLAGSTPMNAWRGYRVPKEENLYWFSNWNGGLCGWHECVRAKGS
jgi:putative transposase